MTLMESSQSDLFDPSRPAGPASASAAVAAASSVQGHSQHPDRQRRVVDNDFSREGVVHGAEIGRVQYAQVMQQGGEEGMECAPAGEQGTDDRALLVDGGGLMNDDEVAAAQGVERFEYLPLVEEEEGFHQFGQEASLLGAGTDNLTVATEGGTLCMQEEEAWIAQGIDTSNYALENEEDSLFEAAIREIINKSQPSGYVHVAEVEEEVGGIDNDQQLDTAPQTSDSLLYTIEVEGVSGHEPVVGLPQDAGTSNFCVGGEDASVSDQTIFAPEDTQFCQAGDAGSDGLHVANGTTTSQNPLYAPEQETDFIHTADDVSDSLQVASWPMIVEQELYSSAPENSDFVLETSFSQQVASASLQIPDNGGHPFEQEGNSENGHQSLLEKLKDDANHLQGGKRKRNETVDGVDVVDISLEKEEESNVVINDQDERGSKARSPLSTGEFVATGLQLPTKEEPVSVLSGFKATILTGAARGTVKQHLGNGVRVSSDARSHTNAKCPEKFSGDEKSGDEGQKEGGGGESLWVKWRGKWEAAIRCNVIDCPSATLKAKPNYSKKKHVVVYFPSAHLFSWVDSQHTCQISENPLPLLTGTHSSGRDAVKDNYLPRRRMLLKLGGEMLDISDRLHIKAVVKSSQDVNVWKAFANEAAAATNYSELGILLVRLHLTIDAAYIKPGWMDRRHGHWKEDCAKAASAASLQKLTKELINAVLWEDVAPLWNAAEQPELDPEWEHWKGEAFEEKDIEDVPVIKGGIPTAPQNGTPQGRQLAVGSGSKRFKEQARARRQSKLSLDKPESSQQKRSKVNSASSEFPGGQVSSGFGHATTAFRSPLVHHSHLFQGQQTFPPRVQRSDVCRQVVSRFYLEGSSGDLAVGKREAHIHKELYEHVHGANHQDAPNCADKKAGNSGGPMACNSGLCSAFLKKKNRRCNRQAKEEISYCGKHKHLAYPESAGTELASEGGLAWESGLCSASMGQELTRCAQPNNEGSIFCRIHAHLATDQSADKNGEFSGSALSKDARCNGITARGVQCTHKPKEGSPFCVKHVTQTTNDLDNEEGETQNVSRWSEGSATKRPRMPHIDSQNRTERNTSSPVQIQVGQVGNDHVIPGALANGSMQRNATNSSEVRATAKDGFRKRKWVSSFFKEDTDQPEKSLLSPGQETDPPKVSLGRVNSWAPRCKGRTAKNDEQCAFRARSGHSLCTKHWIAIQGQKKIHVEDLKVNGAVSGARHLFDRYLKAAEGISLGPHRLTSKKQLLKWTRAEASQDYAIAEELLKLVTMEMSKLQKILPRVETTDKIGIALKSGLPIAGNGTVQLQCDPQVAKAIEVPTSITCGLCDIAVVAKEDIGRHWQDCHRKDAGFFVKGYACQACGRLYSRKHTVRRHWKKRHQSLPVRSPDWSAVCSTCERQFEDHGDLLEHVCSEHIDKLTSSTLKNVALLNRVGTPVAVEAAETLECADCHEEFNTHWDLFHHRERSHKCLETEVNEARSSTRQTKHEEVNDLVSLSVPELFECHICGKKFSLLSDVGLHKEAEHPVSNSPGTPQVEPTGKSPVDSESCRLKLAVRRKSDETVAGSERTLGGPRSKKKSRFFLKQSEKQSSEKDLGVLRMTAAVKTARTSQLRSLRQLKHGEVRVARPRKALYALTKGGQMRPFHGASKCEKFPTDSALLDMAQSACCQSQFLATLHKKYTELPDQLFVRISQICTEANIKLEWLAKGYVCGNGCKEFSRVEGTAHRLVCDPRVAVKADVNELSEKRADEAGRYSSKSDHLGSNSNAVILCTDLSNGQEPVPVVCFVDQDVVDSWKRMHKEGSSSSETFRPWETFNYITKRVLDPSLGLDPENYKVGCSCKEGQCLPESCDHVDIFDNDNLDALDIYEKPMKGRFPYDEKGCILLEEGYLVYECNSSCHCQQTCPNRVLQKGVTVKLEVFRTLQKGWAVRAAQMIPRGTFVCEYLGEVLHDQEANKRGERYDQVGCSYLYDIDAHLDTTGRVGRSKPFVIDATKHGNVARFINHSCAPNLINYQVLVDSMDCQLAHIGLFASRDIKSGEELAYDYRYRLLPGRGCPCHCGAENCRGRLY